MMPDLVAEMSHRANFRNRAVGEMRGGHYRSIVTVTPVTRKSQLAPATQPGLFLIGHLKFGGRAISLAAAPAVAYAVEPEPTP
jgi:hypothetical protein